MKGMANNQFAKAIMSLERPKGPFKPRATYIPEGDCIEFVVSPDDYYGVRLDGLVTVYYSRKTNKVIGALIKGVRGFCKKIGKKFPGFQFTVEVRPLKIEYLFLAQAWTEPPSPKDVEVRRSYDELIKVSEKENMSIDIGDVCRA